MLEAIQASPIWGDVGTGAAWFVTICLLLAGAVGCVLPILPGHLIILIGVLFTAWGVGGFVFPKVQQMLTASSGGSFQSSFIAAGALLIFAAALTFLIRSPRTD
jgi:uncharacterized protein YqgC (DUF456 family)